MRPTPFRKWLVYNAWHGFADLSECKFKPAMGNLLASQLLVKVSISCGNHKAPRCRRLFSHKSSSGPFWRTGPDYNINGTSRTFQISGSGVAFRITNAYNGSELKSIKIAVCIGLPSVFDFSFGFRFVKHETENLKTVEFHRASCTFYFSSGPEIDFN